MSRLPSALLATFLSTAAVLMLVLVPVPPSTVSNAQAQETKERCWPSNSECTYCIQGSVDGYGCEGELDEVPGICFGQGSSPCVQYTESCGDKYYCAFPEDDPMMPCEYISTCQNLDSYRSVLSDGPAIRRVP